MFLDADPKILVFVLISMLVAMSFHEAMHAFTSHWLGDTTAQDHGRLTLNPLKHIDLFTTVLLPVIMIASGLPPIFAAKPVPFNPSRVKYEEFGAALIGIAGPLTNLLLAALSAGILRTMSFSQSVTEALFIFTAVNVALFVFNMIPFPPLDGSRLLYAFAPEPLQRVMAQIEAMGFMAILFFFFIVIQFIGPTIGAINDQVLQFLLGQPLV
jgi:Zn-dependent protease